MTMVRTATQKPTEPPAEDALAEAIEAAIREGFADASKLRQSLVDESEGQVNELRANLEKMREAGINGSLMKAAEEMLTSATELLEARQARLAGVSEDEIIVRVDKALAYVRSMADPDTSATTAQRESPSGGGGARRTPKFRAWIGGAEVTSASATKTFGLLSWYRLSKTPVAEFYRAFREQAHVDLERDPQLGRYEATVAEKRVAVEVLGS